jgi:hypothetical protein
MHRLRHPDLTREEIRDGVRPKTRGDCVDGPRPCLWVSCRYHLALDVHPVTGEIRGNIGDNKHTCALDVADDGPKSLAEVAKVLGISRERVLAIEQHGLAKARKYRRR